MFTIRDSTFLPFSAFVQDLAIAMEVESYKQVRLFQQTVKHLAEALPGGYHGSRHAAKRYIHPEITLANFIELKCEEPPMTLPDFFKLLCAVPDVVAVKLEHKRLSHHYQQSTLLVYSQADPTHGMEFGLTTHSPEKPSSTISARYKLQGNRSQAMEAWRILKHSVAGRELNVAVVEIIDTELRKLAGASDFIATGQTRDSVSSYGNITVASSAVEHRLFLPSSSSSSSAQASTSCQCGECDPNWLRRGWVCYKGRLTKQLPFMLLRNTAAR